jgi:hypothetical protein
MVFAKFSQGNSKKYGVMIMQIENEVGGKGAMNI